MITPFGLLQNDAGFGLLQNDPQRKIK